MPPSPRSPCFFRSLLASALMSALAACAGKNTTTSGIDIKNSSGNLRIPSAYNIASYESTEYNNNGTLRAINASYAYAAGYASGDGIRVAIIDDGVDSSNTELDGQVYASLDLYDGLMDSTYAFNHNNVPQQKKWFKESCSPSRCSGNETEEENATKRKPGTISRNQHATNVAAAIAAKKNEKSNGGFHGIAWNADILSIRADRPAECQTVGYPDCNDQTSGASTDSDPNFWSWGFRHTLQAAKDYGANIVNLSLSMAEENSLPPSILNLTNFIGDTDIGDLVFATAAGNVLEEKSRACRNNWSTSVCASARKPGWPANLAATGKMKGHMIIAGSANRDGTIAEYSHRAGPVNRVAKYFLLVPAHDNDGYYKGVDEQGEETLVAGTSMAAPIVSGALALLLETFPEILERNQPELAAQILLETTDDYISYTPDPISGTIAGKGTDSVGGRGILNLKTAFTPQGTTVASVNQATVKLASILAPSGGAFGDWAKAAFDGIIYQDKYQRGFTLDSSHMASSNSKLQHLSERLASRGESQSSSNMFLFGNIIGQTEIRRFTPAPSPIAHLTLKQPDAPALSFNTRMQTGRLGFNFGYGTNMPQGPGPVMRLTANNITPAQAQWMQFAYDTGTFSLLGFAETSEKHSLAGMGISAEGTNWMAQASARNLSLNDSALGSSVQSRLGKNDDAHMTSLLLEGQIKAGAGWTLSASLEAGNAKLSQTDTGIIALSAWSIQASHTMAGGRLSLGLAQPLRAESGSLILNSFYRPAFGATIESLSRRSSLSPSGRETDIELHWQSNLPIAGWSISAGIATILQAWHNADAPVAAASWLSLNRHW